MIHYPSITSFRKVRQLMADNEAGEFNDKGLGETRSVLKYRGTIKLHGMHCDIVKFKNGEHQFQSRNRILTLEADNKAFVQTMQKAQCELLFDHFAPDSFETSILIAGEYCGAGIQRGVALEQLKERLFVIFGVCIDGVWQDMQGFRHLALPQNGIHNILNYETHIRTIDFTSGDQALDTLEKELDELTMKIDQECPFVKQLTGHSGPGEGLVWTCIDYPNIPDLHFKTKGPSHSVVIKKSAIKKSDGGQAERVSSFVESVVPEARLLQGIDYCQEMGHNLVDKATAQIFTSWITKDVFKEEGDQVEALGLTKKDVENGIKRVTFKWFARHKVAL